MYRAIKNYIAWIEFNPSGLIVDASPQFLDVVGYDLDEVKGKHHNIFCADSYVESPVYQTFWRDLANGVPKEGTFERKNKRGETIILEATYFPIKGPEGNVTHIAKIASDITQLYQKNQKNDALYSALDKSLAIIEFDPQGTILTAMTIFCMHWVITISN